MSIITRSAVFIAILTFQLIKAPSTSASHATVTAVKSVNYAELIKWRVQQYQLYQLRSTLLSEALAKRLSSSKLASTTFSIPTVSSVSQIDGANPVPTDWECVISTEDDPKSCLYSFDAPPNTKVIAPKGTSQWISLYALNRLRRLDPTKVEPMWHSQYTIIKSWFGTSETSVLQHVGVKGWFVSSVLLDTPLIMRALLALSMFATLVSVLPVLEYFFNACILNSSFVWGRYNSWGRFLHAALPFKLLISQMTWNFVASKFDVLYKNVRDTIVDIECKILEDTVPVTNQDLGVDDSMTDKDEYAESVGDESYDDVTE